MQKRHKCRATLAECKIFAKHPAKGLILLESRETFDSIPDKNAYQLVVSGDTLHLCFAVQKRDKCRAMLCENWRLAGKQAVSLEGLKFKRWPLRQRLNLVKVMCAYAGAFSGFAPAIHKPSCSRVTFLASTTATIWP